MRSDVLMSVNCSVPPLALRMLVDESTSIFVTAAPCYCLISIVCVPALTLPTMPVTSVLPLVGADVAVAPDGTDETVAPGASVVDEDDAGVFAGRAAVTLAAAARVAAVDGAGVVFAFESPPPQAAIATAATSALSTISLVIAGRSYPKRTCRHRRGRPSHLYTVGNSRSSRDFRATGPPSLVGCELAAPAPPMISNPRSRIIATSSSGRCPFAVR